jgi:transglutaminase-like putative cysteine protease
MRFGFVHRILLDTLIALGMFSLVATGEFGNVGSVALVLALLFAFLLPTAWQERRGMRLFGTYAPLVLFAVQLLRWADGSNPLTIAVEFTALLQIIRVATRRGAIHDQQLIALSLLQLIAATVLGGGLTFALCFIGFVLITPSALVLSHLRREVEGNYRQGARDRTGLPVDVPRILRSRRVISRGFVLFISLLSLPVFLVTTVIFVSFPRVGLSLLLLEPSRPSRMVGFSDRVDLGGMGALHSDPTLAMRITYPELPLEPPKRIALYLRGTALDRYERSSWSRTKTDRRNLTNIGTQYALDRFPDPVRDPSLTIELEPIEPPVLFVPEQTVALELLPHSNQVLVAAPIIYQGAESELRYSRLDDRRGPKYRVYLQSGPTFHTPVLSGEERQRYLQLPASFTTSLHDLARLWSGSDDEPLAIANRVLERLRKEYRYDLNSPSGKTNNPLEHFLLVSKRGHCEFYSTAMALLLRSKNVPTRNVTGFAGATYNRYGRFYAVRQGDAHSWVEAWIDGYGWKRFDPTPTAPVIAPNAYERWVTTVRDVIEAMSQRWSRHVERYDLRQQVELFGGMRHHVGHAVKWVLPRGLLKQIATFSGLVLMVVVAMVYFWRRRNRRSTKETLSEVTAVSQEIVRLYQLLEQVLAKRGAGRPATTPPLAHALALIALGHPLAAEILDLTKWYLEVRFGGRTLGQDDARLYSDRVTKLRRLPVNEWKTPPTAQNDSDEVLTERGTGT